MEGSQSNKENNPMSKIITQSQSNPNVLTKNKKRGKGMKKTFTAYNGINVNKKLSNTRVQKQIDELYAWEKKRKENLKRLQKKKNRR